MSLKSGTTRENAVVFAACLATTVVWVGVSAVPVIIPDISVGVGASQGQAQWIGDIFPLILAGLLLPAGAVADRWGRRRAMLVGLAVMGVAFLWSAWAGSAGVLIAARATCAGGAALVFPATLATITNVLPGDRRERAIAYWSISVLLGGVIGMNGAALLQRAAWWGAAFVGSAALVALAWLFVAAVVPETADVEHASRDILGTLLSIAGIGGLVYGITEGPTHGWAHLETSGPLALGIVALGAFVWWELKAAAPLLEVRVFKDRRVAAASLALLTTFAASFGMVFLVYQYLQLVHGYDAVHITVLLFPALAIFAPFCLVGPKIAQRIGLGPVLGASLVVCAVGMAVMAIGAPSVLGIIGGLMAFWGGLGMAMTPATRAITDALPAAQQGIASAVNDLSRELGTAVGIAVLGSAFKVGYADHITGLATQLPEAAREAAQSSPALGIQALGELGAAGRGGIGLVQRSMTAGWELALLVGVVLLAVCSVVLFRLGGRASRTANEADSPTRASEASGVWSNGSSRGANGPLVGSPSQIDISPPDLMPPS